MYVSEQRSSECSLLSYWQVQHVVTHMAFSTPGLVNGVTFFRRKSFLFQVKSNPVRNSRTRFLQRGRLSDWQGKGTSVSGESVETEEKMNISHKHLCAHTHTHTFT